MLSIREQETQTYKDVAGAVSNYGEHSPGVKVLPAFLDMIGPVVPEAHTLLDAGCSSGKAGVELSRLGFQVTLMDLQSDQLEGPALALPFVHACLWNDLGCLNWDYIYCTDVLEHIPPEFTMLVLTRLIANARKGVFLSIALQPDNFGVWVGKSLHQTVQPFTWWREHLDELGTVVECRDMLTNGVYLVKGRS